MQYPVTLTPDDNDTVLVTSDDLPEVTTFGAGRDEALQHAADAILEALGGRLARWQATPLPGLDDGANDRPLVRIPLLVGAKVALMNACIAANVNRAELGRRLNWHREQVDRVFRVSHGTQVDQLEAVADALGMDLSISMTRAA
ncbi:MAG TPA: type II toxin-antitoxin system HicB family antitoxin [Methylomirabilota bacterium]|nr:type II toxin-antitoxin system HicB family antitoxin [Methylomirabilota bacterium]